MEKIIFISIFTILMTSSAFGEGVQFLKGHCKKYYPIWDKRLVQPEVFKFNHGKTTNSLLSSAYSIANTEDFCLVEYLEYQIKGRNSKICHKKGESRLACFNRITKDIVSKEPMLAAGLIKWFNIGDKIIQKENERKLKKIVNDEAIKKLVSVNFELDRVETMVKGLIAVDAGVSLMQFFPYVTPFSQEKIPLDLVDWDEKIKYLSKKEVKDWEKQYPFIKGQGFELSLLEMKNVNTKWNYISLALAQVPRLFNQHKKSIKTINALELPNDKFDYYEFTKNRLRKSEQSFIYLYRELTDKYQKNDKLKLAEAASFRSLTF